MILFCNCGISYVISLWLKLGWVIIFSRDESLQAFLPVHQRYQMNTL